MVISETFVLGRIVYRQNEIVFERVFLFVSAQSELAIIIRLPMREIFQMKKNRQETNDSFNF